MTLLMRDIRKSFGSTPVLQGFSLELRPGEVYALLGSNGSGKSTALKIAVGLLEADAGLVRFGGRPLGAEGRRGLGFVPQQPALYPQLTCAETLRFFGRIHAVRGSRTGSRVEEVLRETGLEPRRDQRIGTLSGGWRQRVSVAAALVHDPAVLVMDEPTTGLDVRVRDDLWRLVRSLSAGGTAIILTTHELGQAEANADRVGILHGGRLAAEGSPKVLRSGLGFAGIAEVEAEDGEAVGSWARGWGAEVVRSGDRWLLSLRESIDLATLAGELAHAGLRSLAWRPVGLSDVFREVTGPPRRDRTLRVGVPGAP